MFIIRVIEALFHQCIKGSCMRVMKTSVVTDKEKKKEKEE